MNKKIRQYWDDQSAERGWSHFAGMVASDYNQYIEVNTHWSSPDAHRIRDVFIADTKRTSRQDQYGEWLEGVTYVYNDRMDQWDYEKSKKARQHANSLHGNGLGASAQTAAYHQDLLRYYYSDPKLALLHIKAGCNVSNGYPFLVYGFVRG